MGRKKAEKKNYRVHFTTTGRGSAVIEATSLEEAQQIANAYEFEAEDGQHEWEYDEIKDVVAED